MKYVHVAKAVNAEQSNYSCKVLQEATALIEACFEYVIEMDDVKLFRKRK
jgi:hypothetical protein